MMSVSWSKIYKGASDALHIPIWSESGVHLTNFLKQIFVFITDKRLNEKDVIGVLCQL